jgi:hypothetical protein
VRRLNLTANVCFNHRMIFGTCNPSAGLILERQSLFHKSEPPKLESKPLSRLTKHPAEDRYRLSPMEQRFTIVDRRSHFIPRILR